MTTPPAIDQTKFPGGNMSFMTAVAHAHDFMQQLITQREGTHSKE
jgi:hypothetical protein